MLNRYLWCHSGHFRHQHIEKLCYLRRRGRVIRTECPHSLCLPRGDNHAKLWQKTINLSVLTDKRWHALHKQLVLGIMYVSLSGKAIQSNIQNFCISHLMLENILPLSGNTSAGANVLLQGVDPGFHSVPLYHIKLKSDFVSDRLLLGYDLHFLFMIFPCYLVSIWSVARL